MKLRQLIFSALFAALTAAGSLFKIPVPGATLIITLQTFFVFMTGLLLEPKYALFSQLVYTALGIIGLPIFSAGGGIGYVLQPSFGFIIGFWVCSVIISATVRKNIIRYNREKSKKLPFIAKAASYMLLSIFVLYVFGVAYMYLIFNFYLSDPKTLYTLIFGTTWIFFIGDIIKFSVALPLCLAIQRRLPKPI